MTDKKPKELHGKAGRPAGSRNKKTQDFVKKLEKTGLTPLALLLKTMRNSKNTLEMRLDCAKAAARYCHPTLQSVHTTIGADEISHAEWVRRLAAMDAEEEREETLH